MKKKEDNTCHHPDALFSLLIILDLVFIDGTYYLQDNAINKIKNN